MPDELLVCPGCGQDVSELALAGADVTYGSYHFCCECCLEEWIDAVQDKANDKAQEEQDAH